MVANSILTIHFIGVTCNILLLLLTDLAYLPLLCLLVSVT